MTLQPDSVTTSDGAGVKLTRVLDRGLQQRLDPFLMRDAFSGDRAQDYIAGFPAGRWASPSCSRDPSS